MTICGKLNEIAGLCIGAGGGVGTDSGTLFNGWFGLTDRARRYFQGTIPVLKPDVKKEGSKGAEDGRQMDFLMVF